MSDKPHDQRPGDDRPATDAVGENISWDTLTPWVEKNIDCPEEQKTKLLALFQPLQQAAANRIGRIKRLLHRLVYARRTIVHLRLEKKAQAEHSRRTLLETEKRFSTIIARLTKRYSLDPLTHLYSGVEFRKRFAEFLSLERRSNITAVILIDVNRFKPVNDTLGHKTGDDLLRFLGESLQKVTRKREDPHHRRPEKRLTIRYDIRARLGGDELALLIPAVDGGTGMIDDDIRSKALEVSVRIAKRCCAYFSPKRWPPSLRDKLDTLDRPPTLAISLVLVESHPGKITRRRQSQARHAIEDILGLGDKFVYNSKRYEDATGRIKIFGQWVLFGAHNVLRINDAMPSIEEAVDLEP